MNDDAQRVRAGLNAALESGDRGADAADRLCSACVDLLDVDGVSLSISYDEGGSSRMFGSSGALARELQELQYTFGEGPYLDALRTGAVVMVPDLHGRDAERWPAFTDAALQRGIHFVLAIPVSVIHLHLGALDLYRERPGDIEPTTIRGAHIAAELAVAPLLDVMGTEASASQAEEPKTTWERTALGLIEVYQASGILMAQLQIGVAEAVVRLRAYAFAHDMTASAVAWEIIEHRLRLDDDRTGNTSQDGDAR